MKYNTVLCYKHSLIKVASTERFIRGFRLLISRNNTAAFIKDIDKIGLIYNQHAHQFLSNLSPHELHHNGNNTLDIFLNDIIMKGK